MTDGTGFKQTTAAVAGMSIEQYEAARDRIEPATSRQLQPKLFYVAPPVDGSCEPVLTVAPSSDFEGTLPEVDAFVDSDGREQWMLPVDVKALFATAPPARASLTPICDLVAASLPQAFPSRTFTLSEPGCGLTDSSGESIGVSVYDGWGSITHSLLIITSEATVIPAVEVAPTAEVSHAPSLGVSLLASPIGDDDALVIEASTALVEEYPTLLEDLGEYLVNG